jgi:hypothetical protein
VLEVGGGKGKRIRRLEGGSCRLYPPGRSLRPLRDGVEPEAIGPYAPEGRRKIKAKSIALETPALLNNPYDPGKQMDCAIS